MGLSFNLLKSKSIEFLNIGRVRLVYVDEEIEKLFFFFVKGIEKLSFVQL